jgi:hypothetical protein
MTGPVYDVSARPGSPEPVPAVVSLHLYGVHGTDVARALTRMAVDRSRVRRLPGATFVKLLGTGSGRTFTPRDADPGHWGVLACWRDDDGPRRYEQSASHAAWSRICDEQGRLLLRPLASRGTWAGRTPFGDPVPHRWDGPVAAITRARIRPRQWRTFWSAVPPVSGDLRAVDGLRLAVGIGEAPVGLQGTFSLWDDNAALTQFAHRRSPHVEVMRRTHDVQWYAEELFARFAVVDVRGTLHGRPFADD